MLAEHYDWTRYWYPRGESIALDGTGFPFDPGILNKNLATFDSFSHHQCLVLFGEPGTGKSTVLESEFKAAEQAAAAVGNAAMFRDLGIYSSDAALIRDIFENGKFMEWAERRHVLELFLDSLDECRLRVESIDGLLLSMLKRYDLSSTLSIYRQDADAGATPMVLVKRPSCLYPRAITGAVRTFSTSAVGGDIQKRDA